MLEVVQSKAILKYPTPNTCRSPAELIRVCWLEVTASTEDLKPGKKYQVYFEVSLTTDAFGWENIPVFLMAKIGKRGKYLWKKMVLERGANSDKKFKIPMGDNLIIEVPPGSTDKKLYFGLYEVWSGKWKGGLKIHEATIQQLPDN